MLARAALQRRRGRVGGGCLLEPDAATARVGRHGGAAGPAEPGITRSCSCAQCGGASELATRGGSESADRESAGRESTGGESTGGESTSGES